MLSIRIVAAGAIVWVMASGSAAAQTATNTAPGKPIPLLQILTQTDKTKAKPHARRIARMKARTHLALAKSKTARPAGIAQAAAAEDADAAAPTAITAVVPTLETTPAFIERDPSELVVGGRTVQVVSPDDANEIDLAAAPQNSAPTPTPAPTEAAAAESAPVAVARAQQEASPVGSASWIAQALAALGGAVAAGSVAWFLIGTTPQRTYG